MGGFDYCAEGIEALLEGRRRLVLAISESGNLGKDGLAKSIPKDLGCLDGSF